MFWKIQPPQPEVMNQIKKRFNEDVQPTTISSNQFNRLFKWKRSVGEGTYGAIKCVENCYNDLFAIKESKDSGEFYGLYREVAIMKKFNHPNILKMIAFYQIKETSKLILFTEFCKYKSLKDYSLTLSNAPIQEKYRIAFEVFNGIYALHTKNIMHRDLKPENILIDQKIRAKICDFGFCQYDLKGEVQKLKKVGTVTYNSPQTDSGLYTKKCDIFSYGLIVYFIFNAKNLFKSCPTREELKSSRRDHFKNSSKVFKNLQLPEDIKVLLQNTITQKQEQRFDIEKVKQFWQKVIAEKNLKGLNIIGDQSKQKRKKDWQNPFEQPQNNLNLQKGFSQQESLVSKSIKISQNNINCIKVSIDIINIYRLIGEIQKKMQQLKALVDTISLKTPQKYILSFGTLFILELYLQNGFKQALLLISRNSHQEYKIKYDPSIFEAMNEILLIRQCVGKNLIIVTKYLQAHSHLLRPRNLFSDYMVTAQNNVNVIQNFLNDVFIKEGIEGFKKKNEIDSMKELFELIQQRYSLQNNLLEFKNEFKDLITNYRKEKVNKSAEQEWTKTNAFILELYRLKFDNVQSVD